MRAILKRVVGGSIVALAPLTGTWAQVTDAPASTATASEAPKGNQPVLAEIVVTGSRVATTGANAPTPVTTVSADTLAKATPSNIPDALNKLPMFQNSQQPRQTFSSAENNAGGNVLALRGFGPQRTLVLLDGHRVTPSNLDGSVSPDLLPQMLVSRVDVVTGGASAVYGSDAVTGVVNFILDRKFSGFKLDANTGISTYGDGNSYKIGAAYGTKLFGDRGHFMASYNHYQRDPVQIFDRTYGPSVYVLTGSGTSANPFAPTVNTRRGDYSFGGKISAVAGCAAPCALTSEQFVQNGVLGPFVSGTPTGTGNQVSGGDGAYSRYSDALIGFRTDQAFGRFDYELTDSVNFYASASYAKQSADGTWFPVKLIPVSGTPTTANTQGSTYFMNNPFLSSDVQTTLGNNGLANSSNVFGLGAYIENLGPRNYTGGILGNENKNANAGFSGNLGRFNWDFFYTHGESTNKIVNTNNINQQKQLAASDAVVGANGQIQCYAATQAATAAQYANCVPLNPFGPTAITQQMLDYFAGDTTMWIANELDDVGASISGDIVQDWAGPIRGALSAEFRRNSYSVSSSVPAGQKVDCTGLRICNPGLSLLYSDTLAAVEAANHVWEAAAELNVPLVSDAPLFKSVILNLAARHTDYSTSGPVNTWKVGGVWEMTDEFRWRITRSVDIRAPTLDDLYRPASLSVGTFNDLHTSSNYTTSFLTSGNPNLKPEKADTLTFGGVLQPHFLSGFTLSADYYQIKLHNAITQITGFTPAVQQLCEASNGTGQFCSLFVRPNPFSDTSTNNNATTVRTFNLNAAFAEVEGVDVEMGYDRGPLNLRAFVNYQPINRSQQFAAVPMTVVAAPKTRVTAMANYNITGSLRVGLQDNWASSFAQATGDVIMATAPGGASSNVYKVPRIGSFNTLDINAEQDIEAGFAQFTAYLAIQNVANAKAPLAPLPGGVGIYYPVPTNYDIMGRYFTLGFRMKM